MKRLLLSAAALAVIATPAVAGEMHYEQEAELRVAPTTSSLQAFEMMDLDNNFIVNPIEFDYATATMPAVRGYSFAEMDLNNNGKITRDEASAEPYGYIVEDAEVALVETDMD